MQGLEILVRTGASREEIGAEHDGALVVRLTARPLEGQANKALRKLIAKRLGVPPSAVRILRGEHSRRKLVAVDGHGPDALRAALRQG